MGFNLVSWSLERVTSDKVATRPIYFLSPTTTSNSSPSKTAWTSTMKGISSRLRNQPQRKKRSLQVMENEPWMES